MKKHYDIIVVGGGPGGSMAARYASEGGASVLLLEKDREIGLPVRCAEGITEAALAGLVDIRESWIAQIITRMRLIAPDGTWIEPKFNARGIILHRKLFDADLAVMAADAGAHIYTKAYVYGLLMKSGNVGGVKVRYLGQNLDIAADIVIGADGIESRVGRWAGLDTRTPPENMDSCVQMTLTKIDIDPEVIYLYFGEKVAPEGYLWVFPKGPNTANVGLGVSGQYAKTRKPISYLKAFIDKQFPDASVLTTVAGGAPTIPTLKQIVADGLMLVGDAAHQVNPLTGGGIANAMIAGRIAGRVGAEAVRKHNFTKNQLSAYSDEWMKGIGKLNERSDRIKDVAISFTDDALNKLAKNLRKIPDDKITFFKVFEKALIGHPKLILDAAKVFT